MTRTLNLGSVLTRQRRIAIMAKEDSQKVFTSIHHVIDIDWLREAFYATRKGGAPGVDNRTWQDYEANLEENLQDLLDRAKSGRYVAPPVRRKHIPKGTSTTETRPDQPPVGARYSYDRGSSATACGGHGAGTNLRARFLRMLVWFPTASFSASSPGVVLATGDANERKRGTRS